MTLPLLQLASAIHRGINDGIDLQWRFTKELLCIKPEYLLTVSVAETISRELDHHSQIFLEESTKMVVFAIRMRALGYLDYFKTPSLWKGRDGKVDILVRRDGSGNRLGPAALSVVELKNINPTKSEICKDICRLVDFLNLVPDTSPMSAGFLGFPSTSSVKIELQSLAATLVNSTFEASAGEVRVETGEDPEQGIPVFYTNVLAIRRVGSQ